MSVVRLLSLILLVSGAAPAWAQAIPNLPDRYRSDVAGNRAQPGFDPIGIRFGSFIARADGDLETGYNSNLFGRTSNIVGDGYVRLSPSLRINSDWGRNSVELGGSADVTRFVRLASQNTVEYRAHAGGTYEIGDRILLRPTVDLSREAEPRGSASNRFIVGDPLIQRNLAATLGATYEGGQVAGEAVVALKRERYEPVRLNGIETSQALRDTNGLGGRVTLLYRISPAISALVQAVGDKTSNPHPELCCSRSARGYALLGGIRLDSRGLIAGQVAIGYRQRFFDNGGSSHGLTYEARVQWYPTELLTIDVNANQQFRNSGILASNAVLVSRQSLDFAYEMYRDLNFKLQLSQEAASYRTVNTHTVLRAAYLRGTYTVSRLIQLIGFVQYAASSTTRPALASRYDRKRIGVILRLRI